MVPLSGDVDLKFEICPKFQILSPKFEILFLPISPPMSFKSSATYQLRLPQLEREIADSLKNVDGVVIFQIDCELKVYFGDVDPEVVGAIIQRDTGNTQLTLMEHQPGIAIGVINNRFARRVVKPKCFGRFRAPIRIPKAATVAVAVEKMRPLPSAPPLPRRE